ncbi:sugar ABC transporter ATP-binding protein [Ruegeria sp. HKCCA5014]|uniref:sugar ABC transporter ATP-binding protein n=2 Tax=unclassified Ruegeria TaxID=2625375 RepID=UPI0020C231BB|nr:sugar ABC transporter ATP-binding protein [Ruegeria sp. HKCCA5014]
MTDLNTRPGAAVAPVVSLDGVHMSFGPVHALVDARFELWPGECVGLVGHNGAGKSTLVNVINGRLTPTQGKVRYSGHGGQSDAATGAQEAGIRSVFQELSLCPNLTVLENLRIPYRNIPRKAWRREARRMVLAALDEVFPDHGISADAVVGDLSIAERQMVEIAIAFAERDTEPALVILDEPTSSLDAAIAQQLLSHIKKFCAAGGTIIFISHLLGEIFEVATRILVMKDGRVTQDKQANAFTRDSLVDAMGHVVETSGRTQSARQRRAVGEEVARLNNGMTVHAGEIVGLAGLAGHGQAEALARFYMSRASVWRSTKTPEVAFVAGDRTRDGVMPLWSILKNLSLMTLREFSQNGLVNRSEEDRLYETWKERIKIKANNPLDPILSLSGGNQQKVLFAKALASSAPIVIMDDPMRGVDIGTKKEVYSMIRAEADTGRSFLWYSTETEEVLECDRVYVFRDGEISAELTGDMITEENLLRASFELQEATA